MEDNPFSLIIVYSIIEFDILDVELDFGASAPVVLFELIA
jgi:hypothetical protein